MHLLINVIIYDITTDDMGMTSEADIQHIMDAITSLRQSVSSKQETQTQCRKLSRPASGKFAFLHSTFSVNVNHMPSTSLQFMIGRRLM